MDQANGATRGGWATTGAGIALVLGIATTGYFLWVQPAFPEYFPIGIGLLVVTAAAYSLSRPGSPGRAAVSLATCIGAGAAYAGADVGLVFIVPSLFLVLGLITSQTGVAAVPNPEQN